MMTTDNNMRAVSEFDSVGDAPVSLSSEGGYANSSAVVGFTTAFDRASNKLYERALHAEERSSLYEPYDVNQIPQGGYDSLDRLLQYQRGVLSATGGDGGNGGGSIVTPIALPNTFTQRSYLLDSLGNWRNTVFTPEGGSPQTETRQHNGLNEITRISNSTISELVNPSYDSNGNLTNDETFSYVWDALNRLIAVNSGEEAVSGYYYDALNRRIRKTVGSTNTDFIYSGWRCFEDRNPNGGEESSTDTPIIQYLWGIYLDEVLQITTLVPITTGSGETAKTYDAGTYYPLQDLLYRTTATVTITDESAAIQEAYDFDAYGRTLIFNVAGTDDNWWADNARQVSNSSLPVPLHRPALRFRDGAVLFQAAVLLAGAGEVLEQGSDLDPKRHERLPVRGELAGRPFRPLGPGVVRLRDYGAPRGHRRRAGRRRFRVLESLFGQRLVLDGHRVRPPGHHGPGRRVASRNLVACAACTDVASEARWIGDGRSGSSRSRLRHLLRGHS